MKVLVVSVFPPDPAPEANHALHYSEQLAKAGHRVQVLCQQGSIAATVPGMEVYPVIHDWSWTDLPRLARCLRSCRPDVVLLLYLGWIYHHEPMITFLPTLCKHLLPGIPCITQFETIDQRVPSRSLRSRAFRKVMALWAGEKNVDGLFGTLLRDSARTIVLSSPHRDLLVQRDPEVGKKTVIIPPSPLMRFCQDAPRTIRQQVRSLIGAAEEDFVLIYWGYIYPGKGVETLLQAFRLVYAKDQHVRLVLVGGNLEITDDRRDSCQDYFRMVRELPDTLGIADHVTWTGHFNWDSDAGSRYLHAADLCILPLEWGVTLNNSSLAAACTHGVPVIATELPVGQDEALEHGKNIYLCRPRDPDMLAEAIQGIREDAHLRERLRGGALDLARHWYSWATTTQRLEDVLESAVGGHDVIGPEPAPYPVAQARSESNKENIDLPAHAFNGQRERPDPPADSQLLSPISEDQVAGTVTARLVSVIVAVYNVEKYLSQCLDALVNQTLRNIEIIVVNDASSDRSADIINDYKLSYPSLKVITCTSNKGLASVRNIGLRAATGQYIAFADGDDWVDVRMCEVLYRHAREHRAEVVIADATVFYEDTKKFNQFFDQHIRQTLDARFRAMTFGLHSEPCVLLLEPVAWPKLYERAFLQKHAIQFEDGMNSYEDICFHFSVLVKAKRISLLDDRLFFYRQNRPGQISGRTNRKIFEVFAVFQKIHDNLTAWKVSPAIWAMLLKVQVRQFNWLLKDRVQLHDKREFLASVAQQFHMIPESGFRNFVQQATDYELSTLLCMRRGWLYAYQRVSKNRWPLFSVLCMMQRDRVRHAVKKSCQFGFGKMRQRLVTVVRSLVNRVVPLGAFEHKLRTLNETLTDRLNRLTRLQEGALPSSESLVESRRIHHQLLFLARPNPSGLDDAIWRTETDYYLTQTAVFRAGDTIIDIGAHVGVVSLSLAKQFPFVTVYAIEPDPLNYACLLRNIALNGVANVVAINKAVAGDGQPRTLYADASETTWATLDAKLASSRHALRTVQVESITLDQLFQEYAIRHCRVLKMTAPGAIQDILQGFTRSGCVDLLCGEVDFTDCSRVRLEMASWRIARQHFWRTIHRHAHGAVHAWIHQPPSRIEQSRERIVSTLTQRERNLIEP